MFKKVLFFMVFALFEFHMQAQTIVSTTPENKNVILEEFTGIQCVYCPQGHAITQGLQNANLGDVYLINVHVGFFSTPGPGQPDFRTSFGTALDGQADVAGYPAGTVNRTFFPSLAMDGGTAMGRGEWVTAATQILGESSYVNVAVEGSIDVQTRELSVHVEAYYTGDSPEATNLLNVALLQNNTKGPQVGGNAGNEYNHMHRLVHLLTGQWGQTISTTTTGTFVDETFTYTIPADYNGIPAELGDMEIVAFVSETHQDIISGSGAYPTFTNFANANDILVKDVEEIPAVCKTDISPKITIQNNGSSPLTSLDIEYSINGGTLQTHTWTGNLTSLQEESIDLPSISYTLQPSNTFDISLETDDDVSNNTESVVFAEAPGGTGSVDLVLNTDDYGEECTWDLKDSSGTIVYSGGPYGDNTTITETFNLSADCFTFNLIDSYGDGGDSVTLTDSNGTQLFHTSGSYGTGVSQQFSSDGLGIKNIELQNSISLYPNPANSYIYIENVENADVSIYSILGEKVVSQTNISSGEQINVSQLQTGTYIVKIENKDGAITEKLIITE